MRRCGKAGASPAGGRAGGEGTRWRRPLSRPGGPGRAYRSHSGLPFSRPSQYPVGPCWTNSLKLLFGPYHAPAVGVGDVVTCLYRKDEVVIYDWTLAPIPWPLCYRIGTRACGRGLLFDEELVRAVRIEAAVAVSHWWGVCPETLVKWRRALAVGRENNPGSQRLIRAAAEKGGVQSHAPLTVEQIEQRRRRRVLKSAKEGHSEVYWGTDWTEEELALLGTMPDAEVAIRLGRTHLGVQLKRSKLNIAGYRRLAG